MVDTQVISKKMYRVFRAEVIKAIEHTKPAWQLNFVYPSKSHSELKAPILAFRTHLINEGLRLVQEEPSLEPVFRHALAIPRGIPVVQTRQAKAYWLFISMLPVRNRINRVRSLIQQIGSYEGRHFIYEQYLSGVVTYNLYYNPAVDFAILQLTSPSDPSEYRRIGLRPSEWLHACFRLGVTSVDEQLEVLSQCRTDKLSGSLARALVDLQIISTTDRLMLLKPDKLGLNQTVAADQALRFRKIAGLLRDAGVEPSWLPKLTEYSVCHLDLQRLQETLKVLSLSGEELSQLMKVRGEDVLLASTKRWSFLREVMKVHQPHALASFGKLLKASTELNEDLILTLHQLGADNHSLVVCQDLILKACRDGNPKQVIDRLKLISAPPYQFSIEEVAEAEGYLCSEEELLPYLQVLSRHGFTKPQQILAFQPCFQYSPHAIGLDRCLQIASRFIKDAEISEVTQWVMKALNGGCMDSIDYLVSAGLIEDFRHLNQAVRIVSLGSGLLKYLVERQKLDTVKTIRDWYNDAPGITQLKLFGTIDEIDQVLLDDAFARRDFSLVNGNREIVESYLNKQISDDLGPVPYSSDRETKQHYFARRDQLRRNMIVNLAPRFASMLKSTDGVLLQSLVHQIYDTPEQLQQRVAELTPRLTELLRGGGPTETQLTDLQADLIALMYRTSPSTIRSQWPSLLGREGDLVDRVSPACYPMRWQGVKNELKSPLDLSGFNALAQAARFAARFESHYRNDMHLACYHLSPKRLKDPSADVGALAHHLGVLLAIANESALVRRWTFEFEKLAAMDEEGPQIAQTIEALEQLFQVTLDDVLEQSVRSFSERITPDAAQILASKLGGASDAPANLAETLASVRRVVGNCYLRWAKKQNAKFKHRKVSGDSEQLYAVVSKTPAAFFAKEAANICSSGNTAMWQEPRHAHLLVFSRRSRRIMGMALLYVEPIAALGSRPTLVIRALNLMDGAVAKYSECSIIDSFFSVAKQIASDNNHSAVAFPEPMGMHFMSNHPRLEKEISKRFMAQAKDTRLQTVLEDTQTPYAINATFYAYEEGHGEVNRLYVIWHNLTVNDPV